MVIEDLRNWIESEHGQFANGSKIPGAGVARV